MYFCCLYIFSHLQTFCTSTVFKNSILCRHFGLILSPHTQPSAEILYFRCFYIFETWQTLCTSAVPTDSTFYTGFVLLLSLHIQLLVHICIYAVFTHIQYSADILCFCFAIFKYPVLCRLLCLCSLHILNSLQKCVFLMCSQIQFSGLFLLRINTETVHFQTSRRTPYRHG